MKKKQNMKEDNNKKVKKKKLSKKYIATQKNSHIIECYWSMVNVLCCMRTIKYAPLHQFVNVL